LRSKSLEELETWLSAKFFWKERSDFILYLSILLYALTFSFLTILRYYSFITRAWDFGIFTQSLWTTLNANRFLYHTCELFINPSGAFFGVHFSPILFFVLPLYWALTTPETLLVLQSFILPLAAVPIYKLAKEYAGGRAVGLIFAGAYLLYPAIQFVNLYDFHVQAFLSLFLGWTAYYIMKENWPRYFLFIILSLMCEEHAAWITLAAGIYIAWKHRFDISVPFRVKELVEKRWFIVSLATIAVSAVWYWFTLWQRDTFFPTNPAAMAEFLGAPNFSILGAGNPIQIPLLVIIRPWNTIQALVYDGQVKLLYLMLLFGPLALFSFKAPSLLIPSIPWFGFSLLSQTMAHHTLGHQYEGYLVSFIFVAAIFGLRKNFLKKRTLSGISGSLKKIMTLSLIFFFMASPLCPVFNILFPSYRFISLGEHESQLHQVLEMVPTNASILTQDNVFTQVSHRVDAYVVPIWFLRSTIRDLAVDFVNQTMDKVEYILVDNKTDQVATTLVLSLLATKPDFVLIMTRDNDTIRLYWRKP
jgi:uncharacterized membrane protein